MNRTLAVATAALALAACSPDFDPASRIDKLRVLAVQAEPPEVEPGGVSTLTSLVLRADFDADPARTTTVVHVACIPEPGNPAPSPCVLLASLRDPTVVLAQAAQAGCAGGPPGGPGGGGAQPAPIVAGVEECVRGSCRAAMVGGVPLQPPAVAVPAALDAAFVTSASEAERILGVEAVVLAFALAATPDELVQGAGTSCPAGDMAARLSALWAERDHVLSTKRIVIRGPHAPDAPNVNPVIDGVPGFGIAADGATLDPSAVTTVGPGNVALTPVLPAGVDAFYQPYTKLDANGVPIEATREEWVYSWFSTMGELDELHTRGGAADTWTVEGARGTRAMVAAVVRDLRGGVAWTVREVSVGP